MIGKAHSDVLRIEISATRLFALLAENRLHAMDIRCLDAESRIYLRRLFLDACVQNCNRCERVCHRKGVGTD
ncbi:hypothetical protein Tgr7_2724 [Thioalkalivibrio sulfidiphilus HL-EbGr7]|uniref:Uncharacterized protein n=1 Tax=Thioalkalivibrio sulfidiphilus (strain HL-EbGR7) TaxID=396588 RepID=B8GMY4_THISH|nr:hypothetical protein Tgr7_2724 [Thioalkalivibrio sulfidiphilus HL-EbGr7]